jgi:hypothetical protein
MTTTRQCECTAVGPRLYLACELRSSKWTLGFTTAPAQRPRVRSVPAGDVRALGREIAAAQVRFGLAAGTRV